MNMEGSSEGTILAFAWNHWRTLDSNQMQL